MDLIKTAILFIIDYPIIALAIAAAAAFLISSIFVGSIELIRWGLRR